MRQREISLADWGKGMRTILVVFLTMMLAGQGFAAETEVSVELSRKPGETPSSWLVCEAPEVGARDAKNCLMVPVGPEGISIGDSALVGILVPPAGEQPSSIAIFKPGIGVCRDAYTKYRRHFGRPKQSTGSPMSVPPIDGTSVFWEFQDVRLLLDCQANPLGATVTMGRLGEEFARLPAHQLSMDSNLQAKLRLANESVVESLEEIARSIGIEAAEQALEACVRSGNAFCLSERDSLLAEWRHPKIKAEETTSTPEVEPDGEIDVLTQNSIESLRSDPELIGTVVAEGELTQRASRETEPVSESTSQPLYLRETALKPTLVAVPQDCGPDVRFSNGIRVVKVGCDFSIVLRRGERSGRHVDVIVEVRNDSHRDETIGPDLISANSASVLTYDQAVSRIKRGTFAETFGRFLVGAVEVWGASGSSTRSVSHGTVSGHVDGAYVSGRYTATTIDFSEGRRRADAAIERADADFDQIERQAAAELSGAADQYLRRHTLGPGERVVKFVTIELASRLTGDETFRVGVQTRDGFYSVDL